MLADIPIIVNLILTHSGVLCFKSASFTNAGMDAFLAADEGSQPALQLNGTQRPCGRSLMWILAVERDESFQARAGWPC